MSLFTPREGAKYSKDQLVALCDAYIHSPDFSGNVTEKEQKLSLIEAKRSDVLEFRSRGTGWGNSPLNPNCWVEVLDSDSVPDDADKSTTTGPNNGRHVSSSQYNARPWQAKYRADLLRMWGACAVTGCSTPELLTASHIKPVIYCTDEEKMDPYNGILLSKMYDKLFDAGLITFDEDGRIRFSNKVPTEDLLALKLNENAKIELQDAHHQYLAFHRDKIFKR